MISLKSTSEHKSSISFFYVLLAYVLKKYPLNLQFKYRFTFSNVFFLGHFGGRIISPNQIHRWMCICKGMSEWSNTCVTRQIKSTLLKKQEISYTLNITRSKYFTLTRVRLFLSIDDLFVGMLWDRNTNGEIGPVADKNYENINMELHNIQTVYIYQTILWNHLKHSI